MNTIGERIIYLRDLYDIKQKDVASAIGVTKATMSKYENNINIPNADILCKIAEILKTSTDYLVGRTTSISPYSNMQEEYSTEKLFDILLKLTEENKIKIFERAMTLFEEQKKQNDLK